MLIPPLSEEGGDGRRGLPSHCCVLRYYAVYLPSRERSRPGVGLGGVCSQVGDALMTGRIQNRGWQESDTWCRVGGGRGWKRLFNMCRDLVLL